MKIPTGSYCGEIEVKRSRFIACGGLFEDPGALRERVARERGAHPGCDHVVWAYVCGPGGEAVGMSDDREPKGTAGRPVLEVVKGSGITNILVTVTRYFGGTKLGTGGLVKAYGEAAKEVVAKIPRREFTQRIRFHVELPYESYDAFKRLVSALDASLVDEVFAERVAVEGEVGTEEADHLAEMVRDLTAGAARLSFGADRED